MALNDDSRDWVVVRTHLRGRESELIRKITNPRTPAGELAELRAEIAGIRWALALEERKDEQ